MTDRVMSPSVGRMALAGLCASLVGIGLSRFAYTPLLPQLILAHWFAPTDAVYLGAANLAGYLGGALVAQPLAARIAAIPLLRAMMLIATAAFFACAFPLSVSWFFLWRFLSGLSGGVIMVLAAPTILPHVAAAHRGLAAGTIFVGIGIGIIVSGTLVPFFLRWGLATTWEGLGALSLILSLLAWGGWPAGDPAAAAVAPPPGARPHDRALHALYLEYALSAVGLVAPMVFLVDFIARGLGQGLSTGALYWVLFGLGAMVGPPLAGTLADRIGFGPALRYALLLEAVAVAVFAATVQPIALTIASLLVGAFVPGIVPLVLGRVQELTENDPTRRTAAWSLCTTAFALGQAGGAYGLSYIFARSGDYPLLFALSAVALALAGAIDIAARLRLGCETRTIG